MVPAAFAGKTELTAYYPSPLVEAIKEQQKGIGNLKSELQTQINLLKKEIAELKKK